MSDKTAAAIASGVGPLIAALIGAYQLWLKPKVEEERLLPFDPDRLKRLERQLRGVRTLLTLFILLVVVVVSIPVVGTVLALAQVDWQGSVSLPKVLVSLVAAVGVVHLVFLVARLRALAKDLGNLRTEIAKA
jgi:uncharacterized membrane protein